MTDNDILSAWKLKVELNNLTYVATTDILYYVIYKNWLMDLKWCGTITNTVYHIYRAKDVMEKLMACSSKYYDIYNASEVFTRTQFEDMKENVIDVYKSINSNILHVREMQNTDTRYFLHFISEDAIVKWIRALTEDENV